MTCSFRDLRSDRRSVLLAGFVLQFNLAKSGQRFSALYSSEQTPFLIYWGGNHECHLSRPLFHLKGGIRGLFYLLIDLF